MNKVFAFLAVSFSMLFSFPRGLSSMEINTGPFACNDQWNQLEVPVKRDLYIRKAELWMGMYTGSVADLGFIVERKSDSSRIFRGNWDHYAEPRGINDELVRQDFAPDYFFVGTGDVLVLQYHCLSINGKPTKGHVIVTLWFY